MIVVLGLAVEGCLFDCDGFASNSSISICSTISTYGPITDSFDWQWPDAAGLEGDLSEDFVVTSSITN